MYSVTSVPAGSISPGQTVFAITGIRPPLDDSHLYVTNTATGATLSNWTLNAARNQITFSAEPPPFTLTRITPITALVDFPSGSVSSSDLDVDSDQARYLIEELADRIQEVEDTVAGVTSVITGAPTPTNPNEFLLSVTSPSAGLVWANASTARSAIGLNNCATIPAPGTAATGLSTDSVLAASGSTYRFISPGNLRTLMGLGSLATTSITFGTGVAASLAIANNAAGGYPALVAAGTPNLGIRLPPLSGQDLLGVAKKQLMFIGTRQLAAGADPGTGPSIDGSTIAQMNTSTGWTTTTLGTQAEWGTSPARGSDNIILPLGRYRITVKSRFCNPWQAGVTPTGAGGSSGFGDQIVCQVNPTYQRYTNGGSASSPSLGSTVDGSPIAITAAGAIAVGSASCPRGIGEVRSSFEIEVTGSAGNIVAIRFPRKFFWVNAGGSVTGTPSGAQLYRMHNSSTTLPAAVAGSVIYELDSFNIERLTG